MPRDIISSRPPPLDREQPHYGLAVVFFATCTGELAFDAAVGTGFPIVCTDEDGEPLGSNDFVAGYSLVYAYAALENRNPEILGFRFSGREVTPDCIGDGCLTTPFEQPDCDENPELCVDSCPEDGEGDCPEIPIAPELDRSIVDIDEVTEQLSGERLGEQMWINYYVDRGSVQSSARLLNDSVSGWNEDFGTAFFAPREAGPVHLWAVVHDNRGGVEWVRQTIFVR